MLSFVHGSEAAAGTDQQGLGRLDRASELGCDVGHRQAVEVPQGERGPVVRPESGHRVAHDLLVDGAPVTIGNDAVIVQAGGILPTTLLRDLGVTVETMYGTA